MDQPSTNAALPAAIRGVGLLEALATGTPSRAAFEGLWMAAQVWLEYGGGMPLERFAGLPATGPALAHASRDLWLRRAAKGLQEGTRFAKANRLADELSTFITRGAWRTWSDFKHPPEGASELRTALFYAARFNNGKTLSERQMHRILT